MADGQIMQKSATPGQHGKVLLKTTVFNCIMNFYTPDDGEVIFNGERLDGVTPDRVAQAGINRTYQTIRLFKNLTAIENILVGMHIHLKSSWLGTILNTPFARRDEREAEEEAIRILEFVGLCLLYTSPSPRD